MVRRCIFVYYVGVSGDASPKCPMKSFYRYCKCGNWKMGFHGGGWRRLKHMVILINREKCDVSPRKKMEEQWVTEFIERLFLVEEEWLSEKWERGVREVIINWWEFVILGIQWPELLYLLWRKFLFSPTWNSSFFLISHFHLTPNWEIFAKMS